MPTSRLHSPCRIPTWVTWNCVLVWITWAAGLVLILLACFERVALSWAHLGLASIAFGHLRAVASMVRGIREREDAAFRLGRESVRLIR